MIVYRVLKGLYHCKLNSSLDLMQKPGYLSRIFRDVKSDQLYISWNTYVIYKQKLDIPDEYVNDEILVKIRNCVTGLCLVIIDFIF
jgi:hypothetical protein